MNPITRVLQVFTLLDRGGAEAMIMNYYRNIDRSIIQFDFAVHRQKEGDYENEIRELGGRIFRFLPLSPKNLMKLSQQVANFLEWHPEYQIIHVHTSELGYFFYKEARKRNIPVIIAHAHSAGMDYNLKMPFRICLRQLSRVYPTHYFTCSSEAGEWLFGCKPLHPIKIIRNAIDVGRFSFDETRRKTVRDKEGWQDKFVIGHVGRFVQVKNHDLLIEVLAVVCRTIENALLVLVGGGQLEQSIRRKVKKLGLEKNVSFMGIREDVNSLMQAFDCFMFPSFYEGLSVVLVEAQCAGLPCLISSSISPETDIIPELIDRISIKSDPEVWAGKLKERRSNSIPRKLADKKIIEAGYDIASSAKQLQQFYLDNSTKL